MARFLAAASLTLVIAPALAVTASYGKAVPVYTTTGRTISADAETTRAVTGKAAR